MQDELGPPALAFVRTVCAVLALDSALEDQVAVLRRNLLKLVHVREYASASEFQVGLHTLGKPVRGGVGGGGGVCSSHCTCLRPLSSTPVASASESLVDCHIALTWLALTWHDANSSKAWWGTSRFLRAEL